MFFEEQAPFIIEQNAVRLEGIMDFLFARKVLLPCYRLTKEVESGQRWFAALPGKIHLLSTCVDVVLDEIFQRELIHVCMMGKLRLFLEVETVVTFKITLITGWFGSDMHNFSLKIKAAGSHLPP
jgi:hypothetical protein